MVRIEDRSSSPRLITRQSLTGLDWLTGDIGELRRAYETACRIIPQGAMWQAVSVDGRALGLLIHAPPQPRASGITIVYFHGGGWIVGSPLTHADISGALCALTGLQVISVDYRLAPEHVAPAPIEDGLAAIDYALSGGDDAQIVLCGDSAGAAIALAVASRADETIAGRIAGVVACYGSYGLLDSESLQRLGSREQGLDEACVRRMWLAANPAAGASPYAIAAVADAAGAPVYVLGAERDPVLDDSLALAKALKESGRSFVIDIAKDETHGFLHGGLNSPSARAALTRLAGWITGLSGIDGTRPGGG